jgi:hypothetical protein
MELPNRNPKVQTYRIMKRKNLGNFEHEEAELTIAIDEADDPMIEAELARRFLCQRLNLNFEPRPNNLEPPVEGLIRDDE